MGGNHKPGEQTENFDSLSSSAVPMSYGTVNKGNVKDRMSSVADMKTHIIFTKKESFKTSTGRQMIYHVMAVSLSRTMLFAYDSSLPLQHPNVLSSLSYGTINQS